MQLKDVLIKNGFHFNKRFGQNFLTDKNLLASIVEKAGIKETDTVIEIGVGGGTLTGAIAQKAKRVIGFEIDLNLNGNIEKYNYNMSADMGSVYLNHKEYAGGISAKLNQNHNGDYTITADCNMGEINIDIAE